MGYNADHELRFRKPVMYTFGILAVIGNTVNLLGSFFENASSSSQRVSFLSSNTIIIAVGLAMIGLTRFGKVKWAALLFCSIGTASVSFNLVKLGPDSLITTFYIVIIVIAAAIISPRAAVFYAIVILGLYISLSVWLISQMPAPVPPQKGASVAILSLVIIATTGLLYTFSNSLGQVVLATRQQAEELRRLNQTLQQQQTLEAHTARQISVFTGTLSNLLQEQALTSQTQSTMVTEVAVASQELDAVARKIAENARAVASTAGQAQDSIQLGQRVAAQGVGAIATMRQRVQEINENMHMLNEQIALISEVTDIIGEIADETNLLALNATIEAAGAREYGRRFAVVAEEVQRLARRAGGAVNQIQEMVGQINEASERALAATEQGLNDSQVGNRLVDSMSAANRDMLTLVSQTSTLAGNIATATQQQREASAQIVDVMQRIISTSDSLARASEEVSKIVYNLEESSLRLNQDFADKE